MALFSTIDTKKYFEVILISFLAVEVVSWILSEVADTPILKGGSILFLFLIIILLITLFSIGKSLDTIRWGKEGFFILLVIVGVSALFFILPKIVPELFSTVGVDISNEIRKVAVEIINSAGNIAGYGGTGVV